MSTTCCRAAAAGPKITKSLSCMQYHVHPIQHAFCRPAEMPMKFSPSRIQTTCHVRRHPVESRVSLPSKGKQAQAKSATPSTVRSSVVLPWENIFWKNIANSCVFASYPPYPKMVVKIAPEVRPLVPRVVFRKLTRFVKCAAMPEGPSRKQQRRPGPPEFKIPGLQEFAAAIVDRRKHIPSQSYKDPLIRLFDEFDTDRDGLLTAGEVCAALRSRQIDITEDQAQFFIDAVDSSPIYALDTGDDIHAATRQAFPSLVLHMAASYTEPPQYRHS